MNKKIIHTLVEEVAKTKPNNIAITYNNQQITYEALNNHANGVAHALKTPHQFIATFLPNSAEYVTAILGILKASKVFVPIDTLSPNSKIEKVLSKASIDTIITNAEHAQNLQHILTLLKYEATILLIEEIVPSSSVLALSIDENSPAYLMFTSGSTGEPKAIIGVQKSLSHFIHWEVKEFGIDEHFVISQLAGVTFDVSLRDIFSALMRGACLAIPKERTNIAYLASWLNEQKVSLIHIVPSMLRLLIKEVNSLPSLRYILSAGEALYGSDALKISEKFPHIQLVNLYGPSETTLAKIFNRIDVTKIKNPNSILALGKAISNTEILILKNNKQMGIKQIGEICIRTPFMSKGYLGDEALNQKAFVQNPLTNKPEKIYKTGDMGRYLEDGSIEFVGRMDNQLKINGIRVELEEIAVAINGFEKIENAIVTHDMSENKEITLTCYYIAKETTNEAQIRQYLKEEIATIPNFFVELDKFPLNFHGKIDKKALPKPQDLLYLHEEFIAPQGKIEETIASIFSAQLHIEKIGANIAFTKLGGNSLNAIATSAKISHSLGVAINIKEFFENQSVRALAKLIEKRTPTHQSIPRIANQAQYALSSAQKRLWVLDKFQPNLSIYNIAGFVAFESAPNIDYLRQAVQMLCQHYEILRTNFSKEHPKQIIHDTPRADIFERLTSDNTQETMQRLAERPFDLQNDSLFITKLINNTTLFITMHHIISDGWSVNLIIEQLSNIYSALEKHQTPTLPTLDIQYRDYAQWEGSEEGTFWHEYIKGIKNSEFPLDCQRPAKQSFTAGRIRHRFNRLISEKLLGFESRLFTTLTTTLAFLLTRYSGDEEMVFGTPVANREHAQLENQLGLFMNTLVMRIKPDSTKPLKRVLDETQKEIDSLLAHQSYPFDRLVEGLERDLSKNPLFNIMIILQNHANKEKRFGSLKSTIEGIDLKSTKFDMTFEFREENEGLELMLEYNHDIFNAQTMHNVCLNLEMLFDSLELDAPLSSARYIATPLSFKQKTFTPPHTIIERFEAIAKTYPENIALLLKDRSITYRELNQRANDLAAYLLAHYEIKEDSLIASICDRSEYFILALLAILKAKGAYVAIESSYPQERIEYMLQDSVAILSDNGYPNALDITNVAPSATSLNLSYNPSSLAYVVYTSGTTGKPKGVMVENQSFMNMIDDQIEALAIVPEDRFMQFASVSFDASSYEIFLTLLSGASLVIEPKEAILNNFSDIVAHYGINSLIINPSFLLNVDRVDGLKRIITGGERPNVSLALHYAKSLMYVNSYGPAEASMCSSYHIVDPKRSYNSIPVGKAISNAQIYILDEAQKPIPQGGIGEIYIGGVGVARGYLNDTQRTNERFIEHPKYGRLYKSGDLGRYNGESELEFLGRDDTQVKIRGHRVELLEIEQSIFKHFDVQNVVVVFEEGVLLAYVQGEKIDLNTILPEFMIPQKIIYVDNFVLTSNGKIDKTKLPKPNFESAQKVAPRNEIEALLCKLYGEVLKVEVGIHESFFEFGGDSIKAISLASKLKHEGYSIEVQDIFNHPKIAKLSEFVHPFKASAKQEEITGRFGLSPIMQWYFEQPFSYLHQSVLLDLDITEAMIRELFKKHDMLRARFDDNQMHIESIEAIKFDIPELHGDLEQLSQTVSQSIDITQAPLIRFAKINSYLYIVASHLVVDAISWNILLDDIQKLSKDKSIFPKSDAFIDYAKTLSTLACNTPSYKNFALPKATNQGKAHFSIPRFEPKESENIALLALSMALKATYGITESTITLEYHGRDDTLGLDLGETVGWFTAMYPFTLELMDADIFKALLKQTQALKATNKLCFGVQKYLHHQDLRFPNAILFNYLGQKDSHILDKKVAKPTDHRPDFALNIASYNDEMGLHIEIDYKNVADIEKFIQHYQASFETIQAQQKPYSKIDALLSNYLEAHPNISALTLHIEAKESYSKAYGYANIEEKTKLKPTHRLKLGSITKVVVANELLKLLDSQHIDVEQRVSNYLHADFNDVRIIDLIHHTSGFRTVEAFTEAIIVDDTLNEHLQNDTLKAHSAYRYSALNYLAIGKLIEALTNRSWQEVILANAPKSFMVAPTQESWLDEPSLQQGELLLAHGYQEKGGKLVSTKAFNATAVSHSAGALMGNVIDVGRYIAQIDDKRLYQEGGLGFGFDSTRELYFHFGDMNGYACYNLYANGTSVTLGVLGEMEDSALIYEVLALLN